MGGACVLARGRGLAEALHGQTRGASGWWGGAGEENKRAPVTGARGGGGGGEEEGDRGFREKRGGSLLVTIWKQNLTMCILRLCHECMIVFFCLLRTIRQKSIDITILNCKNTSKVKALLTENNKSIHFIRQGTMVNAL